MELSYLIQLADHSGGILYVLVGLGAVVLTVVAERTWVLRSLTRRGEALTEALGDLSAGDLARLRGVQRTLALGLHGGLIEATLACGAVPADQLGQRLEEVILRHAPLLDRRLWLLDTSVTLAPLLGLLGTIIGMFNVFSALVDPNAPPTQVTGGVAEALIATAAGLLIAVVGLVFFNAIGERVRLVVHQLETQKVILVNRFAAGGPL
ncbi:biopolymer transport protein [Thioflavicoccus mobilis 8321]|uniref:Biopolymer transport protein n=1 Tax=Thioflavicoccus mobilis 8321 TaxID=765912 RepID=L0H1D3_9GAMM|nr:MotA/TolQ/ExbB proton channel family protein [Thioflavicoccus mobilis]AGA91867.1 biopolymer transport protein [Thioflavicoccus mobilis 8321]